MKFINGHKHSEETKRKISISNLGSTNGFKKGYIPWNKGNKLSKEHCKKISESHKGKSSSLKVYQYYPDSNYASGYLGE